MSSTIVPKRFFHSIGKVQGRLVIIGSGWAGFKLLESIDQKNFDVIVISPRNYFLFTPLLASTCTGTLEFRSIIEPIRRQSRNSLKYYEASVNAIDLLSRRVSCTSALGDALSKEPSAFTVGYDKLVIACGAVSNTFQIPGVTEHAHFLKDISDARRIRCRIMECFERALQPGLPEEQVANWLHFVVVGGGPTGIEFSAELHDLITEDLAKMFPQLMDKVQMTLVDVASKILNTFDISLSDYTAQKFSRKGIKIRTETTVTRVEPNCLVIQDGSNIPFGLLVWATGLAPNPLLDRVSGQRERRSGRLLTDHYCRILDEVSGQPMSDVFAIGDCATIVKSDLPCTAQVAKQKAKYLAKVLNQPLLPIESCPPFSYQDLGSMAYIGGWRAIAGLSLSKEKKWNESGLLAWLLWRSAYFTMSVSLRNKILIPTYW